MKSKKLIFSDHEIVDFCLTTKDTNEIHDPAFMKEKGKRVIVPGMMALSATINLSADFLKNRANAITIFFNSLLSSGDFVTLCNFLTPENPREMRIAAINHRDTLSSSDQYSKIFCRNEGFDKFYEGIKRSLDISEEMISRFSELTAATDKDVARFMFAVACTSQALLKSIDEPQTDTEREIDQVINKNDKVSPFYHTLEIMIPSPFPSYEPTGKLDYFIHFTVEKPRRLYVAHVRCEHEGNVLFNSRYKMIGIPDMLIYRMAKEISHPRRHVS